MTISSTSRIAGPFTGNGITTAFPFTFKVFQASDLQVVLTSTAGVETVKTLTTHYTVSLNANQDSSPGGTVNMLAAPASGELLTVTSAIAETQGITFTNNGGWYPTVINDALDKLTIICQQITGSISRSLKIPISSIGVNTELPTPTASRVIGWNSAGTGLANYLATDPALVADVATLTDLASTATGKGAALVWFKQSGAGAVSRTTSAKLSANKSVQDFDTLSHAQAAANVLPLLDETTGRLWVLGGKTPAHDEAAGVLARVFAVDNLGSAVTIAAGKQLDYIGIRNGGGANDHTIGAGSQVEGVSFYLRSLLGSDATSNMYGVIGNVYNAGPGTSKGLYGRAIAELGCTGAVIGLVAGINTVAGISHATGLQITPDTDAGGVVNEGVWITSNTATTANINYGVLIQDVAIQSGGAGFQMQAKGTGDFIKLKNSTASSDLFKIDSTGTISALTGISVDVSVGSQKVVKFSNTTRDYQLQAVTSGDYFRIIAGGIGDVLRIESNGNTGINGFSSFGSGQKVLGLPNSTVPTTNPTGGGIIYVDAGALKYRGSSGTVTTLAVA